MTLRLRLLLSWLLIITLGFFYLVRKIVDVKEIKPRYMESVEEPMVDTAQLLAAFVEGEMADGRLEPDRLREAFHRATSRRFAARIYGRLKTDLDMGVYITDATGHVIFDSDHGRAEGQDFSRWNDVHLTLQGKYGARSTRADPNDSTSSVLYVGAPIYYGDAIAGVLSVSKPQKSMAGFMESTRSRIIYLGCVAAVLVVLGGSLLSTWLTRPIQQLTAWAEAVRDGRRVALPRLGRSEIATLGRTMEDMREALEGKKYVERYVSTLTHEIKSPLAGIRAAAELLHEEMAPEQRERFLHNIEAETRRLQEIVDRMLLLSATEARRTLEAREPVDLVATVREARSAVADVAQARGVRLELELPKTLALVLGDPFLLSKAVLNLLQNAIAFAPRESAVAVTLQKENERWTLRVADSGPGVPEYALPRVFERFFSLPRPESGLKSSGLGLALVREVATLHGGRAELANRPEGGAVATLELPPREA